MDAIESGIVKIPRIPVDDDAAGQELVYLRLWDNIQPPLPKRRSLRPRDVGTGPQGWVMPEVLEGALRSLYRSYQQNYTRYTDSLAALGEPPPVLIVVCPNTIVSKLVFDWIAGRDAEFPDGTSRLVPGNLPLLSNVEDGALDAPGSAPSSSTRSSWNPGSRSERTSGRQQRERSRRSSSPTGCATRAPTWTSSPTPTCCARR